MRRAVLTAGALLLVVGCGASTSRSTIVNRSFGAPQSPHDRAVHFANEILSKAPSASGLNQVSAAPAKSLAQPPQVPGLNGLVTESRFATIDKPYDAVLAELMAATPRSLRGNNQPSTSSGGGPNPSDSSRSATYTEKPATGIDDAEFTIETVPLSATTTGVGFFAQVTPDAPRPAASLVPTGTSEVSLREVTSLQDHHPVTRTATGAAAARLVSAFNAMQVDVRSVHGCPELVGQSITATFRVAGHTWLARDDFCGGVDVTRDGTSVANLAMSSDFQHALNAVLRGHFAA